MGYRDHIPERNAVQDIEGLASVMQEPHRLGNEVVTGRFRYLFLTVDAADFARARAAAL